MTQEKTNVQVDKLTRLKEKNAALKAQIQMLENKEKEKSRKLDMRLKILLGSYTLDKIKKNKDARKEIEAEALSYLTRERDHETVKNYFENLNALV